LQGKNEAKGRKRAFFEAWGKRDGRALRGEGKGI
jgi:hypothetical protein